MSSLRERSLSVARAHMIIVARPQHDNKKSQRQVGTPTTQNGYLPIMRLEDQRLKQARCISDRFQVFRTEFYSEGKYSL